MPKKIIRFCRGHNCPITEKCKRYNIRAKVASKSLGQYEEVIGGEEWICWAFIDKKDKSWIIKKQA